MYGTNSIFVVKYIFPKYLPEFINSESLPPTPQTVSCMQRRMARRAYSTKGERVSPPPPGRLAGYLNLAAVHSLERELSLLLINSGKYLGKIYFTTKILFLCVLGSRLHCKEEKYLSASMGQLGRAELYPSIDQPDHDPYGTSVTTERMVPRPAVPAGGRAPSTFHVLEPHDTTPHLEIPSRL